MVLRMILRHLLHNPHIVNELAESRFMRRLAQITAYVINRAEQKGYEAIEKMSESDTLKKMSEERPETGNKLSSFSRTFAKELQKEMQKVNKELKSGRTDKKD